MNRTLKHIEKLKSRHNIIEHHFHSEPVEEYLDGLGIPYVYRNRAKLPDFPYAIHIFAFQKGLDVIYIAHWEEEPDRNFCVMFNKLINEEDVRAGIVVATIMEDSLFNPQHTCEDCGQTRHWLDLNRTDDLAKLMAVLNKEICGYCFESKSSSLEQYISNFVSQMERESKNQAKRLINLTPHTIKFTDGTKTVTLPPSGKLARIKISKKQIDTAVVDGLEIPVRKIVFEELIELPPPLPNTFYVVPFSVAHILRERHDLFVIDDTIRDENDQIIARAITHV